MKRFATAIMMLLCMVMSFLGCSPNNDVDKWQEISGPRTIYPEEDILFFYDDHLSRELSDSLEKPVLEMFNKEHPDEYRVMIDPIPFKLNGENIIIYHDNKNNVYINGGKKIGNLREVEKD